MPVRPPGLINTPSSELLGFAGEGYATGSSRDWAAKGPCLFGVKAIVARRFERIQLLNLTVMGELPVQFQAGQRSASIPFTGSEMFDLEGLENGIRAKQKVTRVRHAADGTEQRIVLLARPDTPFECEYDRHGDILAYALRQLLAA